MAWMPLPPALCPGAGGRFEPTLQTTTEENAMPKYLLSYHGGNPNLTEAEQESSMAAWGAWLGGLGDA